MAAEGASQEVDPSVGVVTEPMRPQRIRGTSLVCLWNSHFLRNLSIGTRLWPFTHKVRVRGRTLDKKHGRCCFGNLESLIPVPEHRKKGWIWGMQPVYCCLVSSCNRPHVQWCHLAYITPPTLSRFNVTFP